MSVDLVGILLAGYAPLAGVISVLWRALQLERADHMKTLKRARDGHERSMSGINDRITELEHAHSE